MSSILHPPLFDSAGRRSSNMETKANAEIDAINKDLYGMDDADHVDLSIHQVESVRSTMEMELYNIPVEQKKAYIEASVRNPQLLETDSNPLFFVKSEHMKEERAAKKMTRYWNRRKELFGEQAFLPLANGAAIQDDQGALSANVVTDLPDDLGGRAVLYYSVSSLENLKQETRERSVLKALWFLVSRVVTEGHSQHNLVLLLNFDDVTSISDADLMLHRRFFADLIQCLPVRVRAIHVCGRSNDFLPTQVIPMVEMLVGKRLRKRVVLHQGDARVDLASSLEEFGLIAEALPASLGGTN